ncbi:hypothetical protein [Streptomyces griseomycini]|uniref:Uncharacterized protein n=1 Tax=Streptomyces griseomycini TaxID=66895 RepID=A0A7W7M1J2_9ACTN|nr:hypothetical protein [Streptomyces griseomycini]MBB4899471.1 hypothetical protein [Streptomyces griseomycini]GGR55425.1 hypothetical protein GCM10015536_70840 [Streptomyces griseomycini]
MDASALPRYASDPEGVIAEAVVAVELAMPAELIGSVVRATFPRGAQRRKLAELLQRDLSWLTQGRSESPAIVERFVRALREQGAVHVQQPRCGACGQARLLVGVLPGSGSRICNTCEGRRRHEANPCAVCGRHEFRTRDREGRPRCRAHPPDDGVDPMDGLCQVIQQICPTLPEQTVAEAVRAVEPVTARQRKLLWALEDRPGLLTGQGAQGPVKALHLIAALREREAVNLVVPGCPYCGRNVPLPRTRNGLRCCAECRSAARAEPCAWCGRDRPVMGRTHDGLPLCQTCRQRNPVVHQICAQCGERRYIQAREDDHPLCGRCHQYPTAACSECGERRPCLHVSTDAPICFSCTRKRRPRAICVGCDRDNQISYRTADGEPLCSSCGATHRPCAQCGRTLRIHAIAPNGDELCPTCWRHHPARKRPCSECGTATHLHHYGLCPDCAARARLREVLSVEGRMRPGIEPVFKALSRQPGTNLLYWLNRRPARRSVLRALAAGSGPVTHDTLDGMRPAKVIDNLRMHLVAGGALPARDEQLAALERWLAARSAQVRDPESHKVLQAYIAWHLLRRLRRFAHHRPVSQAQAHGVRAYVTQVVRLLNWLHTQDIALSTCTQDLLDTWLDDYPARGPRVHSFLAWTSRHGHTRQLTVELPIPTFTGQLIAQDTRWQLVNRLIHDDEIPVPDKAAGLLALLFAQDLSRIVVLTAKHVEVTPSTVLLRLGQVPAQMPPPLDGYIRTLHAQATATDTAGERWLFPGRFPAQHLSRSQLVCRLHPLGLRPRMARNTALVELASELPALVVSRLLGVHQNTADSWNRIGGQDNAYAAEVASRPYPTPPTCLSSPPRRAGSWKGRGCCAPRSGRPRPPPDLIKLSDFRDHRDPVGP